jgi:Type II CAAX prenyl endopeptidase Rce1-like
MMQSDADKGMLEMAPGNPPQRAKDPPTFTMLLGLALMATLAGLPCLLELSRAENADASRVPDWFIISLVLILFLPPTAVVIALGLRMARGAGLRVSMLQDRRAGQAAGVAPVRNFWALSLGGGLAVGFSLMMLAWASMHYLNLFPFLADEYAVASPWKWALMCVFAGVIEELYFRLGLVTLLVWLGTKILSALGPSDRPPWCAIVLSSIAFGLTHLYGEPIDAQTVSLVLVGNGIAGTLFGWLYWQYGVEAAMLAHFSEDVVLKLGGPLIGVYV